MNRQRNRRNNVLLLNVTFNGSDGEPSDYVNDEPDDMDDLDDLSSAVTLAPWVNDSDDDEEDSYDIDDDAMNRWPPSEFLRRTDTDLLSQSVSEVTTSILEAGAASVRAARAAAARAGVVYGGGARRRDPHYVSQLSRRAREHGRFFKRKRTSFPACLRSSSASSNDADVSEKSPLTDNSKQDEELDGESRFWQVLDERSWSAQAVQFDEPCAESLCRGLRHVVCDPAMTPTIKQVLNFVGTLGVLRRMKKLREEGEEQPQARHFASPHWWCARKGHGVFCHAAEEYKGCERLEVAERLLAHTRRLWLHDPLLAVLEEEFGGRDGVGAAEFDAFERRRCARIHLAMDKRRRDAAGETKRHVLYATQARHTAAVLRSARVRLFGKDLHNVLKVGLRSPHPPRPGSIDEVIWEKRLPTIVHGFSLLLNSLPPPPESWPGEVPPPRQRDWISPRYTGRAGRRMLRAASTEPSEAAAPEEEEEAREAREAGEARDVGGLEVPITASRERQRKVLRSFFALPEVWEVQTKRDRFREALRHRSPVATASHAKKASTFLRIAPLK